jgi:hypothetical protein
VAAISAYKAALQPLGLPQVGVPLPVPIVAATLLYCCLYIREEVGVCVCVGVGVGVGVGVCV